MDEPNGAPEDNRLVSRDDDGPTRTRPSVAEHRRVLRGDCARCAGLCCVALAFDRSEWFSFDKSANVACQHLLMTHRCAVHHSLGQRGLSGCVHYDCYGAGQRIA